MGKQLDDQIQFAGNSVAINFFSLQTAKFNIFLDDQLKVTLGQSENFICLIFRLERVSRTVAEIVDKQEVDERTVVTSIELRVSRLLDVCTFSIFHSELAASLLENGEDLVLRGRELGELEILIGCLGLVCQNCRNGSSNVGERRRGNKFVP